MASYFTHGIVDPLSCTGTQWIVDKVMLEHSLHSVLICDIPTVRFQLDCSRAAVCNLASAGVFRKVRATMRAITVKCTVVRALQKCIVQSSRKVHFPSPLYE